MLLRIDRLTRAGALRCYLAVLSTGQTAAIGQMTLMDPERLAEAIEDQTGQRVRLTADDVQRALEAGLARRLEETWSRASA